MVEMADIQVMTEKATPRSLIIIDELGRGTSTSEGMAIAQAVIEYVHDTIGCKSLVSTHFHELAHLEESLKGLKNVSMAVQESGENVHFLRKLVPGPAGSSYGIYCARLAGLPSSIIGRAYTLLQGLEQSVEQSVSQAAVASEMDVNPVSAPVPPMAIEAAVSQAVDHSAAEEVVQLSIFGEEDVKPAAKPAEPHAKPDPSLLHIVETIKGIDVMNMTPLQAMQLLNDLKMKAKDL